MNLLGDSWEAQDPGKPFSIWFICDVIRGSFFYVNNAIYIVDTQEMLTICYWHTIYGIFSYQCYLNFPFIFCVFLIFPWDILQLRQVILKLIYTKQINFSSLVSTFRMSKLIEMNET